MKLKLKVTHDAITSECETSLVVIVQWERKYKKRAGDLAQGFAVEDLAFMAWASLKRAGKPVAEFDAWLDKLEEVEVVGGDDSNPTDAAATAGN